MNTLLSSVYPLLGTFTMPKAARDKASGGDGAGGVMDNDLFSWMIIGLAIVVLGIVLAAFYQNWSAGRELRKQRELVNQIGPRRLRNLSAGPRRR